MRGSERPLCPGARRLDHWLQNRAPRYPAGHAPRFHEWQILQIYLNWRHENRSGSDPKVWTWGWGSHAKDFDPDGEPRLALLEMLPWIETHFRSRTEPDGSSVLQYATHLDVADAYLNWKTENIGVSSFSFDSLVAEDWPTYPWLQAVAEEMRATFGRATLPSRM